MARHPDAGGGEHPACLFQDLVRGAVDQHGRLRGGPRLEDHDPVHEVLPHGDPVLHDHQRGARLVEAAPHGVADFQHTGRVEVGRGLVQQDQPGPHRQDAGQRKALFLPAGQRRRRVVQRKVRQPDVVQRLVHARPDLVAGNREVLRAEGDVVAEAGEHHLGFGVLLHEAGTAAPGARRLAVDQEAAGFVGVVTVGRAAVARCAASRGAVAEHAGEGVEQRGFAGAGGPQEQDALPGTDVQVQPVDRGFGAAGVAPAPAAGGDRGGADTAVVRCGHQEKTGSVAALRDANELSTPVLARPRVAIQDRAPAMIAPEMAVKMMYASLSPAA